MRKLLYLVVAATACGGGGGHGNGADGGGGGGGDGALDGGLADGGGGSGADPSFGAGGLATIDLGGGFCDLTAAARQSDGRVVGAGSTLESFVLVRATTGGQLDTTFGSGGVANVPIGVPQNVVNPSQVQLVVQSDDKLVVTGALTNGSYSTSPRGAIVRLTADGQLDTTFGSGGFVISPAGEPVTAIALAPGDAIVAGAGSALLRYASDGTLDAAFGVGGVATVPHGIDAIAALAVGSDGAIVVAGSSALARMTAAGAVDPAFGASGQLVLPNPTRQNLLDEVAVLPDGKIVAAGSLLVGSAELGAQPGFAVVRATAAGALDATFGGGDGIADDGTIGGGVALGFAVTANDGVMAVGDASFGGSAQRCVALDGSGAFASACAIDVIPRGTPAALPDGSLVVPGIALDDVGHRLALGRTFADGSVDAAYSVIVVAGSSYDDGQALAVQADGSVLAGGATNYGQAVLVRLTGSGAVDPSFGVGGVVEEALGDVELETVSDVAVQPSGGIVVGGPPDTGGFVALRFDGSGALDGSFGAGGVATIKSVGSQVLLQSHALAMGSDGSLFVIGESTDASHDIGQLAVVKLTPGGAVDASYGSGGLAQTAFTDSGDHLALFGAVGSDGSVLALGGKNRGPISLVRFDATGALDATYGGSGALVFAGSDGDVVAPFALARTGDGGAVAVVGSRATASFVVLRVAADGTLAGTTTLQLAGGGNDYFAVGGPVGLAIDGSGDIWIGVADAIDGGMRERAVLARLLPDGTPDASWGPAGIRALDLGSDPSALHALRFQPDGKLLAAGRAWTPTGNSDLAVVRALY
nr:hypothetical protein [Kofleriaceae bacterium]